jgi:hypothetical protein
MHVFKASWVCCTIQYLDDELTSMLICYLHGMSALVYLLVYGQNLTLIHALCCEKKTLNSISPRWHLTSTVTHWFCSWATIWRSTHDTSLVLQIGRSSMSLQSSMSTEASTQERIPSGSNWTVSAIDLLDYKGTPRAQRLKRRAEILSNISLLAIKISRLKTCSSYTLCFICLQIQLKYG